MKKIFLMAAAAVMTISAAKAQSYDWAVGVRAGGEMIGANVKRMFNPSDGLEVMLATPWDDGFVVTALYERHIPVIDRGFNFYYGAGAHVGGWNHKFALGVDGIVGLEYKIPDVPLVLSVDYKPVFNIVRRTKFYMADLAFSLKVSF